MRILVAAIGRLKQGPETELCERYRKRAIQSGRALGWRDVEIVEIRESRAQDAERRMVEESIALANVIPPQAPGGFALDSELASGHGWCPVDPSTFASTLVPALAVGLNWQGATRSGAMASIATGLVVTLALESAAYFKAFTFPAGVTASAVAMVASFLVFFVVSWLTRRRAAAELDEDIRLVMEL